MNENDKKTVVEQHGDLNGSSSIDKNALMMHLSKAFSGVSLEYYIKHFIIGLIIILLIAGGGSRPITVEFVLLSIINVCLYPYSRIVYDKLLSVFPIQQNIFVTIISTLVCLGLAVFIAPFGLIYLYMKSPENTNK